MDEMMALQEEMAAERKYAHLLIASKVGDVLEAVSSAKVSSRFRVFQKNTPQMLTRLSSAVEIAADFKDSWPEQDSIHGDAGFLEDLVRYVALQIWKNKIATLQIFNDTARNIALLAHERDQVIKDSYQLAGRMAKQIGSSDDDIKRISEIIRQTIDSCAESLARKMELVVLHEKQLNVIGYVPKPKIKAA